MSDNRQQAERQHSTENRLFIVCANVSIDFFVIYVIPISIEFPVAWKFQARFFRSLTHSRSHIGVDHEDAAEKKR